MILTVISFFYLRVSYAVACHPRKGYGGTDQVRSSTAIEPSTVLPRKMACLPPLTPMLQYFDPKALYVVHDTLSRVALERESTRSL